MSYQVYQLKIARHVYDYVNQVGHAEAAVKYPEWKVARDIRFEGSANWEPSMFAHFGLVCEIAATSLNEVFDIGNIGPEEKIVRHDRMHSVSVGDIIQDPDGVFHMVDDFGFNQIAVEQEQTV
jgi:hypothetical protein